MNFLSCNIKYLRKQRGLTQEKLANKIGLKRAIIGSYEEDRALPKLSTIQIIANYFKVSLDKLVNCDLSVGNKGNSLKFDIEGKNLRVLSIIVDDQDQELISLVPVKAAAGYLNGYADPEYIAELPKFRLPVPELLPSRTYRAFQIEGDSMEPILSGSYIICEYIQDWQEIKDGYTYILITKDEGIVYKRVINKIADRDKILFKSDNPEYKSYTVDINNILEVWKALGYINFELPDPEENKLTLRKLSSEIMELKNELEIIKEQN